MTHRSVNKERWHRARLVAKYSGGGIKVRDAYKRKLTGKLVRRKGSSKWTFGGKFSDAEVKRIYRYHNKKGRNARAYIEALTNRIPTGSIWGSPQEAREDWSSKLSQWRKSYGTVKVEEQTWQIVIQRR